MRGALSSVSFFISFSIILNFTFAVDSQASVFATMQTRKLNENFKRIVKSESLHLKKRKPKQKTLPGTYLVRRLLARKTEKVSTQRQCGR